MFDLMKLIFGDKTTGTFSFKPFSLCHIIYLAAIIVAIVVLIYCFRNKKKHISSYLIGIIESGPDEYWYLSLTYTGK